MTFQKVAGFKRGIARELVLLNECAKSPKLNAPIDNSLLLKYSDNFVVDRYFPEKYNAVLLNTLYLLRSLIARTYRTRRMVRGMPARGQRRWSHAETVKKCNLFLRTTVLGYERDLWGLKSKKQFRWSKLFELRQKAKLKKKKKPTKKWKKLRKFGERRLKLKKKKKTPWQ